jgi:hypothetical protein
MNKNPFNQYLSILILIAFFANTFGPLPCAQAQEFRLPAPGVMVPLSPEFDPPLLKGIKVHPDNPFRFDFIMDKGSSVIARSAVQSNTRLQQNSYFYLEAKIMP